MRVRHGGMVVADIPNASLTDDAPLYHRPVGEWKAPVPLDPPAWVLEELAKPRDYTADLRKLLASANVCSKRWVYEQYDSMVQTNTVQGPGGEAGVMRIKGTQRGLSMALAGNGRWCYLDPKLGAMHAVAEAARKVACTGAVPVAATNCLNFGNPEKPEIMRQLSDAIDGIAEACNALGTPITGGNVSLYNETRGEGIYPTPVVGVVGILEDVTNAIPSSFASPGDWLLLVNAGASSSKSVLTESLDERTALREFGSSEYARAILGNAWGQPPTLNLQTAAKLQIQLAALSSDGLIGAAVDVADGGTAVALAEACFSNSVGVDVRFGGELHKSPLMACFGEDASRVIVSCSRENISQVDEALSSAGLNVWRLGVVTNGKFIIHAQTYEERSAGAYVEAELKKLIDVHISHLRDGWSKSLEDILAASPVVAEVMA